MCFCNCWTARTRSLTHVLCWSPFTCRCLAWICLCWVRQNPRRSNVDGREKGRFQSHAISKSETMFGTVPTAYLIIASWHWVNAKIIHYERACLVTGLLAAVCVWLPLTDCSDPLWTKSSKKIQWFATQLLPRTISQFKTISFHFYNHQIKSIILLTSSDRPKSDPTLLFFLVNGFNYILLINLIVNEKTVCTGGCVIQLEWNARPSGSFFF